MYERLTNPSIIFHGVSGSFAQSGYGSRWHRSSDFGQGLRRFWAKSVFLQQTVPAQSAIQASTRTFPWAWSATIFQTVPKTGADLAHQVIILQQNMFT